MADNVTLMPAANEDECVPARAPQTVGHEPPVPGAAAVVAGDDVPVAAHEEAHFGAHNYHPLPVVLERGEGAWLFDVDGRRYLDMMSAYSAVSVGHAHPRILRRMNEQAAKLSVCSRAFYTNTLGPFLNRLCSMAGMDMALPMNTGAEAVETAIKAARRWGYRVKNIPQGQAEIIVCDGNFHGRTTTIVSFSSDPDYSDGFGPLTPGFRIVPFGDIEAMRAAVTENTCAILVEPIQGEAGIRVPPKGWLKGLRDLCDERDVLLILDEIQSGLARTGKMFAFEHEGIVPDGLTLGKALGGGVFPVSAFLARRDVMEMFDAGSHGSTFGGNPLAAAIGHEALCVIEEEGLVERSASLGAYMRERLLGLNSPVIREVRGPGLWIGIEIDADIVPARTICEMLMRRGILSKETHRTVVRLAPPLVITRAEIDWALAHLADVLDEVAPGTARRATA